MSEPVFLSALAEPPLRIDAQVTWPASAQPPVTPAIHAPLDRGGLPEDEGPRCRAPRPSPEPRGPTGRSAASSVSSASGNEAAAAAWFEFARQPAGLPARPSQSRRLANAGSRRGEVAQVHAHLFAFFSGLMSPIFSYCSLAPRDDKVSERSLRFLERFRLSHYARCHLNFPPRRTASVKVAAPTCLSNVEVRQRRCYPLNTFYLPIARINE